MKIVPGFIAHICTAAKYKPIRLPVYLKLRMQDASFWHPLHPVPSHLQIQQDGKKRMQFVVHPQCMPFTSSVICLYPLCIPFASSASQGAKLHSFCIPFASTVLKLPASPIYGCIHISSTMHLMHPMHPHYIFNTS